MGDKILIAVATCNRFQARADIQRNTWVKEIKGADVVFFLARQQRDPLLDEVFLDCRDEYDALPEKVREIFRWAIRNDYDRVLKLDDDTQVYSDRLMANVPSSQYTGFLNNSRVPYCSGFAYWLDRNAMRIVAEAEIPTGETAEDRFVGTVLSQYGIFPRHDQRYAYVKPPVWRIENPDMVIAFVNG